MTDTEQLIEHYSDPAFAPPKTETVHAGPLSVVVTADGDIRYIRSGEHELIRRVYAAVRASDWWTVPAVTTVLEKTVGSNTFRIVSEALYSATNRGIGFRAILTLTGDSDGRVTFDFDGEALTDFERKRIGICVLHPADAKGTPVTVTHTDGSQEAGSLPDTIAPHQPFFDIAAIRHTVADGLDAEVTFTGDVFEMEDQRNWLDASFKTYSTPLALPTPVVVKAGERVRQTVTVRPHPAPLSLGRERGENTTGGIMLSGSRDALGRPPLPSEGEGGGGVRAASIGIVWSEDIAKPDATLSLPSNVHIWLELDLAKPRWQKLLARADEFAWRNGSALYVCIKNAGTYLRGKTSKIASAIGRDVAKVKSSAAMPIPKATAKWFVIGVTEREQLQLVREIIPSSSLTIGFVSNFTELNRIRPDVSMIDSLFFAGNPQVHATDSLSIAETPPMIAEVIRTARVFANGRPVHVGPLTFTGPYAANDPRETARFGQEWYEQILAHAVEAGADSVTLGASALPVLMKWHAREGTR
ncbi:MAG: hypothetical protein H7145_09245 [Akkermansiaceae bacterium]|nr:hypothetical protein [Armatimonadota bacterium]